MVWSFIRLGSRRGRPTCFDEFSAFANAVGMTVQSPGSLSPMKLCGGIEMSWAWLGSSFGLAVCREPDDPQLYRFTFASGAILAFGTCEQVLLPAFGQAQ